MLTTDRVAGTGLVLLALYVLWESRALPLGTWQNPGPAAMPVGLALVALLLGLLVAVGGARAPRLLDVGWREGPRALVILAVCAGATLGLERLGYRLTMFLALLFLVRGVERRRTWLALCFSAGLAWGSFFLFHTLLRVPLPRGPWGL